MPSCLGDVWGTVGHDLLALGSETQENCIRMKIAEEHWTGGVQAIPYKAAEFVSNVYRAHPVCSKPVSHLELHS